MRDRKVHLELWIEPGSDPISGWVASANGVRQPFGGWVELTAAIETARRDDDDAYVTEPTRQRA